MAFARKIISVFAAVVVLSGWPAMLGAQEKEPRWTTATLPLDQIPAEVRERIRKVVDQPALYTHGPGEDFVCDANTYFWLLDHPDRAVQAWRRVGARSIDIHDDGADCFSCADPNGNEVHWTTVYRSPQMRIWYAEGAVRPSSLLKPVSGEAVLVLRHVEGKDTLGRPSMHHQIDMFLHADSKTATLVAKILGASMPRLAEQYVSHLGMFFSLMAGHIHQHPDRAADLLAEKTPAEAKQTSLTIPTSASRIRDTMNHSVGQQP